jgi:hypothetical protein
MVGRKLVLGQQIKITLPIILQRHPSISPSPTGLCKLRFVNEISIHWQLINLLKILKIYTKL